jgi:hypothetical protein
VLYKPLDSDFDRDILQAHCMLAGITYREFGARTFNLISFQLIMRKGYFKGKISIFVDD